MTTSVTLYSAHQSLYPSITVPRFRDVDAVGALRHRVELDPQAVSAERVQALGDLKIKMGYSINRL